MAISTGINLSKFSTAKPILRKDIGVKKDDFVMIYAGLIVPRKGIDVMLKVTQKLSRKNKNIKLLLVGDGPSKKKYFDLIKQLKIGNNVVFLGWRKDIPSIMKSSNVLILPSTGEGLPGVIMEAMASGLPTIASNIPCIPDLVDNNATGYLCNIADVGCYVKNINKLIENKKLREKLGKNAKKKISLLEWDKLLKSYKKLYS